MAGNIQGAAASNVVRERLAAASRERPRAQPESSSCGTSTGRKNFESLFFFHAKPIHTFFVGHVKDWSLMAMMMMGSFQGLLDGSLVS